MRCFLLIAVVAISLSACTTTTYYISRHAEKAGGMSADPSLTTTGEQQAEALRSFLRDKKIGAVYSTNYLRTKATAQPAAADANMPVRLYNPAGGVALVDSLKSANRKNVLIVGHSNTVDDLVNRFVGSNTYSDLPDSEYGSLFVVKKQGDNYKAEKITLPGLPKL